MKGDTNMKYKDYKKKALSNPKIKKEYDALGPEYDLIQAMIDARVKQDITQKELSKKTVKKVSNNKAKKTKTKKKSKGKTIEKKNKA